MRAILAMGLMLFMLVGAQPAFAQEEIVVTAQKRLDLYEELAVPNVRVAKRADFVIRSIEVVCDTRDAGQRRSEIRATLADLERAAARSSGAISLAVGDEFVRPFTAGMAADLIRASNRAQTDSITLLVRTPLRSNDTLETAEARMKTFVDAFKPTGRTEVLLDDESNLTMTEPSRHRPELIRAIVADARDMAGLLGPGYAPRIAGLENQIAWQRTGELELTLFIPYQLEFQPPAR